MTHRGPFQPLLFWDSVILWRKPREEEPKKGSKHSYSSERGS